MPGRYLVLFALLAPHIQSTDLTDVQEIVRHAAARMEADWAAAPEFAFVQRDVTTLQGVTTSKTHQVFLIAGSDYYMPIAMSDVPLSAEQQKLEMEKLKLEVDRRKHETPEQAAKRSQQYRKLREQNGVLLGELTKAFDFALVGEEAVNGHPAYILEADPKPDYRPPSRTAKILTGMKGCLWVDKESFHWVKVEAVAIKSVPVFGFFAKVLPGTKMELELMPVTDSIWLESRFAVDLNLSVFWRKSTRRTESTFSDYRPAAPALAEALSLNSKYLRQMQQLVGKILAIGVLAGK
jgi:hypothetical protein